MVNAGDAASATNNDCVRIKGANSDYTFDVGSGTIIENKAADPLFLKIFICPNKMPSRIEKPHHGKWCEGTDQACPQPEKAGHAMICLHQTEGISLVSQTGVTAKGSFQVQPTAAKSAFKVTEAQMTTFVPFVMQPEGKDPVLHITEAARTLMVPVMVRTQAQKTVLEIKDTSCTISVPAASPTQTEGFQISVSNQGIVLKTPDGAMIQLNGNSIEITPSTTGKVKINGNLEVTGEVTIGGKKVQTS